MANVSTVVLIVGVLFCAVTSANVTLSTVGTQEVNETNPTLHVMHVSADNDTDDGGIAGATDEPENATQPPLTTRVTLPAGSSSTHPPLVHINNKETSASLNTSSPPTPVNINSVEHTTAKSSPTTPTTSSQPPLVHATMEPTAAKSEIPKAQQGHNGVKGLHSSLTLVLICFALAKSYVTC